MKKVKVEPGCISCGTCEFVAPDVFEVTDVSRVKENVCLVDNKNQIKQAMELCPVQVIKCDQ